VKYFGVALLKPLKLRQQAQADLHEALSRDELRIDCVFDNYDAIIDAACQAWNNLIDQPETITSIGMRKWATNYGISKPTFAENCRTYDKDRGMRLWRPVTMGAW